MLYVYLGSFVGFFASVVSMAEIASMYVSEHEVEEEQKTERWKIN